MKSRSAYYAGFMIGKIVFALSSFFSEIHFKVFNAYHSQYYDSFWTIFEYNYCFGDTLLKF
jgi:hypothetical protein